MNRHALNIVSRLLANPKSSMAHRIIFCILLMFPVIFIVILNYRKIADDSMAGIFSQKQSVSILAARIIHDKLENLINLCVAVEAREELISDVESGNWQNAASSVSFIIEKFPFIERLVLYDSAGVIKADYPAAMPSVIGQSRSDKEWYRNLTKNWKPLLSDIYKRGAEPKINVICVVAPIEIAHVASQPGKGDAGARHIRGILQLQVNLEVFSEWTSEVNVGEKGLVYVVDQHGHIVYHPRLNFKDSLIDFSSVPTVARLKEGVSGVELNYNPIEKEERISAYAAIPEYGWGVVITQPSDIVFKERNKSLANLAIIYAIIAALSVLLSVFVMNTMLTNVKLQKALDEITILRGIVPICAWCHKVRNDKGYWDMLEQFISEHSKVVFTHGICPECAEKMKT